MEPNNIDLIELRIALVRKGWSQWQLAAHMQMDASTLSGRLRGTRPAPREFVGQVEAALGLEPGTLSPKVVARH